VDKNRQLVLKIENEEAKQLKEELSMFNNESSIL
jgi:hypothetical protein